jgi:hypothetical protein
MGFGAWVLERVGLGFGKWGLGNNAIRCFFQLKAMSFSDMLPKFFTHCFLL